MSPRGEIADPRGPNRNPKGRGVNWVVRRHHGIAERSPQEFTVLGGRNHWQLNKVAGCASTWSPHWRGWPKPENRCLVPANSVAEYAPEPNPGTRKRISFGSRWTMGAHFSRSPASGWSSRATAARRRSRFPVPTWSTDFSGVAEHETTLPSKSVDPGSGSRFCSEWRQSGAPFRTKMRLLYI
jgi:hypothetical protein